jgi:putative copper export protein
VACDLAVLPRAEIGVRRGLLHATGVVFVLVTLASFGILLSRTLEMNGGAWASVWSAMGLVLHVTHYGHIWVWRVPALVLLWLAWGWARRHPEHAWAGWLMAIALAAIVLTRSDTGHPADHGDFKLAVWVDWAHMLAAGAWVGSLFGMTLVVFPKLRAHGDPLRASAAIFQRLSTLSGAALAVVLAAGIYNALGQLGSFAALWTSRYGTTLDVKVAIVLAMIAIGAHNRYIKLPKLLRLAGAAPPGAATGPGRTASENQPAARHAVVRSCARAVLLESVLGLLVIGAAANLIHSMPPADAPMQMMQADSRVPNAQAGMPDPVAHGDHGCVRVGSGCG